MTGYNLFMLTGIRSCMRKIYRICLYATDLVLIVKSVNESVSLLKTKTRKMLISKVLRFKEVVPPAPKETLFSLRISRLDGRLRIIAIQPKMLRN
jgi:hypothetical protein